MWRGGLEFPLVNFEVDESMGIGQRMAPRYPQGCINCSGFAAGFQEIKDIGIYHHCNIKDQRYWNILFSGKIAGFHILQDLEGEQWEQPFFFNARAFELNYMAESCWNFSGFLGSEVTWSNSTSSYCYLQLSRHLCTRRRGTPSSSRFVEDLTLSGLRRIWRFSSSEIPTKTHG